MRHWATQGHQEKIMSFSVVPMCFRVAPMTLPTGARIEPSILPVGCGVAPMTLPAGARMEPCTLPLGG